MQRKIVPDTSRCYRECPSTKRRSLDSGIAARPCRLVVDGRSRSQPSPWSIVNHYHQLIKVKHKLTVTSGKKTLESLISAFCSIKGMRFQPPIYLAWIKRKFWGWKKVRVNDQKNRFSIRCRCFFSKFIFDTIRCRLFFSPRFDVDVWKVLFTIRFD